MASCRNFIEWLDVSCGGSGVGVGGQGNIILPSPAGGAVTAALLGTLRDLNNEGVAEDDLITPNQVLSALR